MTTTSAAAPYFQGGDCVELLNAQGKAPASTWKLQGKISKSFDKAIKGNAFHMDGSSETKMQLPKTSSSNAAGSLGLTQRFAVFQLLISHTRSFSMEIGFTDFQKTRKRFVFASAFRETTTTALHVQVPIASSVPRDQWMNLVFDLHALTEQYFPGSSFRSMESICISGSCRLKRIFTMKDAPHCAALEQKMPAQLLAYKQQKTKQSGAVAPPISVASFAEMKEIPKQFVFSAGSSCLPIPTEYFGATADAGDGCGSSHAASQASQAAPSTTQTNRVTGAARSSAADVKKSKAAATGASGATVKTRAATATRSTRAVVAEATNQQIVTTRVDQDHDPSRGRSAPSSQRMRATAARDDDESTTPRFMAKTPESSKKSARAVEAKSPPLLSSRRAHSPQLNEPSPKELKEVVSRPFPLGPEFTEGYSSDQERDQEEGESFGGADDLDSPLSSPNLSPVVAQSSRPFSSGRRSKSPHVTDGGTLRASKERKQHRQHVIAEIQSKLDALTKEAEEEDARDRTLFLKHTRLATRTDDPIYERPSREFASLAHMPTRNATTPIDSPWQDKEMLRSPEPMVLRRMHTTTKKPEINFSSSIFSFDRGSMQVAQKESLSTNENGNESSLELQSKTKTKKLFDWESLLEDSVGFVDGGKNKTPTLRGFSTSAPTATVMTTDRGKEMDIVPSSDNEEDNGPVKVSSSATPRQTPRPTTARKSLLVTTKSTSQTSEEDPVDPLESSFDFSMSPVLRRGERNGAASSGTRIEKRCVEVEHDHSAASSPRAESEGGLSLDLTDDLEDMDSPPSTSDGEEVDDANNAADASASAAAAFHPHAEHDEAEEDSFDFDDLVVCDRYSKSAAASSTARDVPAIAASRRAKQDDAAAASIKKDQREQSKIATLAKKPIQQCVSPSPLQRTEPTTTGSPAKHHKTRTSQRSGRAATTSCSPASLDDVSSSSQRRLASLLESTDWSQLPLSSTVASKTAPSPRQFSSKTHTTNTTKQRSNATSATSGKSTSSAVSSSIELIYDPILRCYYDPIAKKYYALAK